MRNLILPTLVLICLSYPAVASDYKDDNARISELEMENKNLNNVIAKMHASNKNTPMTCGEIDIAALESENKELQMAMSRLASQSRQVSNCEKQVSAPAAPILTERDSMISLKSQNQSLRETIRAQGEMLVSADNAIKTAERLLSENTILQRKLEQMERSNNANIEMAKNLVEQNEALKKEISQRDAYINRKGGGADIHALKLVQNMKAKMAHLKNNNKKLERALNEERRNGMADRVAVQRYKSQMSDNEPSVGGVDGDMSKKISFYRSNIAYLEAGINLKDKEIAFLKLENQELNARLNLAYEDDDLAENLSDDSFYSLSNDGDMLFDDEMAMQQ